MSDEASIDPDIAARRTLRRFRAIATTLLLGMAGLTIGSHYLSPSYWTEMLRASATAGLVGGLADWFAVTALFRRPLGLPIPHTAIIPREKARLGQALGRFVSRHVVNSDEVQRLLERLDVGRFVASLLSDPAVAAPMARSLAGLLPRVLATVEDGRARRMLSLVVPRMLGGAEAGRVVARAMGGLVEGGRHQDALTFILEKLRETMLAREDQLRAFIEEKVRDQGGRLVGWALGATIASRLLMTVNTELQRMDPNGSELRDAFDEWVRVEITRMEEDPERARALGRALRGVVAHRTVQAWTWDVWSRLRHALEVDAGKPNGRAVAILEGGIRNLGTILAEDPEARAKLQRATAKLVIGFMPVAQAHVASFIAEVVSSWDTETITDRLELRVGRDLQYVRMNGTLVGFLAGGAVFAATTALFGGKFSLLLQ